MGIETEPAIEIEYQVRWAGTKGGAVIGSHHRKTDIDTLAVEDAVGVIVDLGNIDWIVGVILDIEERHLPH